MKRTNKRCNLDDLGLVSSEDETFVGWCGLPLYRGILKDLGLYLGMICPYPEPCNICPLYKSARKGVNISDT